MTEQHTTLVTYDNPSSHLYKIDSSIDDNDDVVIHQYLDDIEKDEIKYTVPMNE